MRKQRVEAVQKGAEQLFSAEAAIDKALSETGTLASLLPSLRLQAHLSAVVGQDAVDEVCEAMMALARARRSIVATHARLADVRDQIGCRTVAQGGLDKPDDGTTTPVPATGHLRAVAGLAA